MRLLHQATVGARSDIGEGIYSFAPVGRPFLVVPNPEFITFQMTGTLGTGGAITIEHSLSKNGPWVSFANVNPMSALGTLVISPVVNCYIRARVSAGDVATVLNLDLSE